MRLGDRIRAFVWGMASAFDMYGAGLMSWRPTEDPQEADARALFGDWCAVGRDLEESASCFRATPEDEPRPML